MILGRLAALFACGGALLAGCGSEETLTAEEFVSLANEDGAGLSLGEELTTSEPDVELFSLRLSEPRTTTASAPTGDLHGAGSLKVTPGSDEAEAEFDRCEGAVTLICYRAANIVVTFEGLTHEERSRLDQAFEGLSLEPGEAAAPAEGTDSAPVEASATSDRAPAPSGRARRTIDAADLDAYRAAGADLGLDWTVIAAVDQLEGGSQTRGPASERILAIGYELQGLGAPSDYRGALEARASPEFADRALALAEKLGIDRAVDRAPASHGRLELPTDGTVVAGYGSRYGVVHDGVDIEAPDGTPIRAAASGTVVSAGFSTLYGNQTCVAHRLVPPIESEERIQTCYGNQSRMGVAPGDVVRRGEEIGAVGCSGPCLRPHVHFRVLLGTGEAAPATDPAPFLVPAADADVPGRPLE